MLIKKSESGKWYPNSITDISTHLRQLLRPVGNLPSARCSALVKNVAYSLQHLEFLYRIHEDLKLSEVIEKQNIKTFVIVGASVIEALFFYILVAGGKASMTDWKSIAKVDSAEFEDGGQKKKLVTEVFDKLPSPVLEEMTFDAMCKRVEKRALTKLSSHEFYQHLPHLRKLRNRVHIHTALHGTDTDYFAFEVKDMDLVRRVLRLLLTSSFFPSPNEAYWEFLKVKAAQPGGTDNSGASPLRV